MNSRSEKTKMFEFIENNRELFDNVIFKLKCVICKKVAVNAQQSICTCTYCYTCLFDYVQRSRQCPREGCTNNKLDMEETVAEDMRKNNLIKIQKIRCPVENCKYQNSVDKVATHNITCHKTKNQKISGEASNTSQTPSNALERNNVNVQIVNSSQVNVVEINNLKHDIENMKEKHEETIQKLNREIENLKRENAKIITLNEIRQSPISIFVWCVDNIIQKREDAKHNKSKKILNSDPFFTNNSGYKLRLYMNPNGYDTGLNTHLSVLIQIMRSGHDETLTWPFTETVKYSLINMKSNTPYASVTFSFKEADEENRDLFDQPKEEFNDGLGLHKFVSWTDLLDDTKNLIKDGSIYIKVDLEN